MPEHYTNAVTQARMAEIGARLAGRMQAVSTRTGIDFSRVFTQTVSGATETRPAETERTQEMQEQADAWVTDTAPALNAAAEITPAQSVLPSSWETYAALIQKIAGEYGISPALIAAVIQAESNYVADAVSPKGATGLMQLMPATAAGLGVTNAYDPEQNIDGGVRYLLGQIIRFNGDVKMALAAYNCGASGLLSRGITSLDDPAQRALLPLETQKYLDNITAILSAMGRADLLEENYYA
jgi:soluble lytic murein transglycosylase-like protein